MVNQSAVRLVSGCTGCIQAGPPVSSLGGHYITASCHATYGRQIRHAPPGLRKQSTLLRFARYTPAPSSAPTSAPAPTPASVFRPMSQLSLLLSVGEDKKKHLELVGLLYVHGAPLRG